VLYGVLTSLRAFATVLAVSRPLRAAVGARGQRPDRLTVGAGDRRTQDATPAAAFPVLAGAAADSHYAALNDEGHGWWSARNSKPAACLCPPPPNRLAISETSTPSDVERSDH
jgi:hypothetical protein